MQALHAEQDAQPFIARWRDAGGSERANYQLFVGELCALLGVPLPQPAQGDERDNAYVFERRVAFAHGDGSTSAGFIDCYRRGAFVLEAKKLRAGAHSRGFDDALLRARAQDGLDVAVPSDGGVPAVAAESAGLGADADTADGSATPPRAAVPVAAKRPWPAGLPEQIKAVAELLAASPQPLALADIEARFSARGRWRERLPVILDTLAALGRARRLPGESPRWAAG